MAKFLFKGIYTPKGLEGLLKEGGTKRQKAVKKAVNSLGGKLESFYYTFGESDVFGIADMPDNISAASFSLLVSAAGGATIKTVVLITPEEIDKATQKSLKYRSPGKK